MAFNVTIIKLNDETGNALVEFEDTSSGIKVQTGVYIPEEYLNENDLLDYVATLWPHQEFAIRGKAKGDRYTVVKDALRIKKNITGKVPVR